MGMDCSRHTSHELVRQQPAKSTAALLPRKTSKMDRTPNHGLNELNKHLGRTAVATEVVSALVYTHTHTRMQLEGVEFRCKWYRIRGSGQNRVDFCSSQERAKLGARGYSISPHIIFHE